MRPLKLVVEGLRSYGDRQEIDFTDKSLIAIIGKTGAGKSSLLEGIFCALFGVSTWDLRSATALIADGEAKMRVELTFSCQGKTWLVRRVLFRSTTPARHELVCLDDESVRFDSKTTIADQITRLIGLSPKAFLKTILLPQGRFQALLYADDHERTPILKTLLGLDTLDVIAKQAAEAHRRLEPQLRELRTAQDRLNGDPVAWADELLRAADAANDSHRRLTAVHTTIMKTRTKTELLRQTATDDIRAAAHLERMRRPDAAAEFVDILARRDEHALALNEREKALDRACRHRDHIEAFMIDVGRVGHGLAESTQTVLALRAAKAKLTALHEANRDHGARTAGLAIAEKGLPEREALSERDTLLAAEASRVHGVAVEARDEARRALDEARNALAAVRADHREALRQAAALAQKAPQAEVARSNVGVAETRATDARRAELTADEAHEAAIRANAAAHVASTCTAGDPCPVCRQPVPATFTVAAPPDESATASAKKAAHKLARTAAAAYETAKGRAGALEDELAELRAAQEAAVTERTSRSDHLTKLLGPVDFACDDAVVLAALNAEVQRTGDEEDRTRQAQITTSITARTNAATVETARTDLGRERTNVAVATSKLNAGWTQLRNDLLACGIDTDEAEIGAASPLASAIDMGIVIAEQHQTAAVGLADELSGSQNAVHAEELAVAALHTSASTQFDGPVAALTTAVASLAAALSDIGGTTVPAELAVAPVELDEHPAWASSIDAHVMRVIAAATSTEQAAAAAATTANEAETIRLAEAGAADIDTLNELIANARADAKIAERDLGEARRQIPIAADLKHRMGALAPLVDALDDVCSLMTDGSFPAAAIAQRQERFLELASDRFQELTDQRFGFAKDFRIVDGLTSQARDAKTLSGGETFLASLALALAVVDFAGRAGGRVDAFFLDEGFGSLDQDALNQALDTLSRQTLGGRLIAVISHMSAVVEDIDDVLLIDRTHRGSSATWASKDDRMRIAETDYQELLA